MPITVEILINDAGGRFRKGERGVLLVNDFSEKYDYFVRLDGSMSTPFGKYNREFYFYTDEIKLDIMPTA